MEQRSARGRGDDGRVGLGVLATVASLAAVAIVAIAVAFVAQDGSENGAPGAQPTGSMSPSRSSGQESPSPNDCEEVPFRPTFVPLGLGGRALPGSSAEPGEETPNVRGHWPGPAPGIGVDLIGSGFAFSEPPSAGRTIEVLGAPATLSEDGEVGVVEFSFQNCDWALAGYDVPRRDLRRMAEGLIESSREDRSACRDKGVPFRPSQVPAGWSAEPRPGEGRALGVFGAAPEGETVGVYISEDAVIDFMGDEPVRVLGNEGRIGGWDEGHAVMFTFDGCAYTLLASVEVQPEELKAFAESLRPTS